MKTSKIVEAIGYIDDDLIAASIDYKPRKIRMKWIPYAAAAACAACFCIFAVRFSNYDPATNNGTLTAGNAPSASEVFGNTNGTDASNASVDTITSSGEKPGSGKPEDPTNYSTDEPNAYLSTRSATFTEAKEQVKFVDVKEVSGADFVGYELEYIMPSETLLALKYVYVDGEVHVIDNGVVNVFSPELCEKIERDNMVFWKSTVTDPPSVVYISESDVAYIGMFRSDADLSKAIDTIKALI